MLSAEWRTADGGDTILIIEGDAVRQAIAASAELLSRFLTVPGDLTSWRGDEAVESQRADPASWGTLVIARAASGEVIKMDPELYWNGIYSWFRSRGVDYDSIDQHA